MYIYIIMYIDLPGGVRVAERGVCGIQCRDQTSNLSLIHTGIFIRYSKKNIRINNNI